MAGKKRKSTATAGRSRPSPASSPGDESRSPEAPRIKPPRRNVPMLVVSIVLLAAWLAYLGFVAWRAVA